MQLGIGNWLASGQNVLPKATFEQLKNNYRHYSHSYGIDTAQLESNSQYIKNKLSQEHISLVSDVIDKINPQKCAGLEIATKDEDRSYYNSQRSITKPEFYLTLPRNRWNSIFEVKDIDVMDAVLIEGHSNSQYNSSSNSSQVWLLKVNIGGEEFAFICPLDDIKRFNNFSLTADGKVTIGKVTIQLTQHELFKYLCANSRYLTNYRQSQPFPLTYVGVASIFGTQLINKEELSNLMIKMITNPPSNGWEELSGLGSGISKVYSKNIEPYMPELRTKYPVQYCMMKSIAKDAGRTIESVKLSTIFNATFESVKDVSDLVNKIWPKTFNPANVTYHYNNDISTSDWYQAQDSYKEGRRKALKSQGNRAITKIMEEVESLNLDAKTYPKTYEAITNGSIPIGTFFRKSEQYFIFNDNWQLWEEMLTLHPDIAIEIAKSAAPRTTYEKDLMSYFYFVLHTLPEYLEAQTGKKWTCSPKLVDEANELEPPKEEGGVSRKRSALTPVADNATHSVVVPYASLAIPGRQTTYCYSLDYQVIRKGFSFKGCGTVLKNLQKSVRMW